MKKKGLIESLFVHADTALILGQRLGEWCGHGPILEQDIALTNIALDYVGRSRLLYQYISSLDDQNKTEDDYAYFRNEEDFRNILLVEYPNTDFGYTVARQFFIDTFYYHFFKACQHSSDQQLKDIAEKSLKETIYHKKWSSEWMIRLGDGTEISHEKIQTAINDLWSYTGELFIPSSDEKETITQNIFPDISTLKELWLSDVKNIFTEATLKIPENNWAHTGGKNGRHTEHMGYILSEMQYIQRTHPGLEW